MVTYDDVLSMCFDLASDPNSTAFILRTSNIGYRRAMRIAGKQFEERTKTTTTVANQQYYQLPIDFEFAKSMKTLVGTFQYPTSEIRSQTEWDNLNRITNISNTRPTHHFIRLNAGIGGDEIGFWPIPSATGNLITFVYEAVPSDVGQTVTSSTTGSLTNGSNLLNDTAATFTPALVGRYFCSQPPVGDGQYYKINQYISSTQIGLQNYYEGPTFSSASYGIFDLFGIAEEAQMVPVYYTMWHYFLMRKNPELAEEYKRMHDFEMDQMNEIENDKTHGTIITRERNTGRSLDYPEWFPSQGITPP